MIVTVNSDYFLKHQKPVISIIEKCCVFFAVWADTLNESVLNSWCTSCMLPADVFFIIPSCIFMPLCTNKSSYLWSENVFCTKFKGQFWPCVRHALIINSLTVFWPPSVCLGFVWFSEKTLIISLSIVNQLIFIVETRCVLPVLGPYCQYLAAAVAVSNCEERNVSN
jgi:hypothetical protein